MPELGEAIAIGVISEFEGKCPFDHTEPKHDIRNKLDKDSGALRESLGSGKSTKLWTEEGGAYVQKEDQPVEKQPFIKMLNGKMSLQVESPTAGTTVNIPLSPAAHHLIPTNASFLPCNKIMAFVAEDKGDKIVGNIGYDVNGSENGIWLPTHSAASKGFNEGTLAIPGATASKYAKLPRPFKQRVADAMMEHTKRQFHDSHTAYSDKVKEILEKIENGFTTLPAVNQCPDCKKILEKYSKKRKPPHSLSLRLDGLATRLKKYLTGDASSWQAPLFTSAYAASYAQFRQGGQV